MSDSFALLMDYSDRLGANYGTEDFCIFLYALAKMQKPKVVLELGTGFGVTTFWLAKAVAENGRGHVWTVDNGSHWQTVQTQPEHFPLRDEERSLSYAQFIKTYAEKFGLSDQVTLLEQDMPPYPPLDDKIDLLFYDFMHSPVEIMRLFIEFLPRLAAGGSIFMDRISTTFDSYIFVEYLIGMFNQGRVPRLMIESLADDERNSLVEIIKNSRFTLMHLTELKDRKQNSCTWLKVDPFDLVPHPRTTVFF